MTLWAKASCILALFSSVLNGFNPSRMTELLLWISCCLFVIREDRI